MMGCCHADFALVDASDRGFTLGMPTFTFGSGVLAEAGDNARELALKRVALFTDRRLASSEHVAKVKASLAAADVDTIVYDEIAIEPTDVSLQRAAQFAREAKVDGYVSVGGGRGGRIPPKASLGRCRRARIFFRTRLPRRPSTPSENIWYARSAMRPTAKRAPK